MKLSRREFLILSGKVGAGLAVLSACGIPQRELQIHSPNEIPEDVVRGENALYATCNPDIAGCEALLVRVHQGRAIKTTGNPNHPISLGKHSIKSDAMLQVMYHPDRLELPLYRRTQNGRLGSVSWERAISEFSRLISNGVAIVSNPLRGLNKYICNEFIKSVGGRLIEYDHFDQGFLKKTISRHFGTRNIPFFDVGNAHSVISFGTDWLNGWLSPNLLTTQYSKFRENKTNYFIHVDSYFSLTASNADLWIPAKPGYEGHIAAAIAKYIIDNSLVANDQINNYARNFSIDALSGFSIQEVAALCEISPDILIKAAQKITTLTPSVSFAGGSAQAHSNSSFIMDACYGLNLLLNSADSKGGILGNPDSPFDEFNELNNTTQSYADLEKEIAQWRAGFVNTVIIRGLDLGYLLPNSADLFNALKNVPNVIVFSNFRNELTEVATMILPETTFFENWSLDVPEPLAGYQVVTVQQKVIEEIYPTGLESSPISNFSFGDVLIRSLGSIAGYTSMEAATFDKLSSLYENSGNSGSIQANNAVRFNRGVINYGGWWNKSNTSKLQQKSVNIFENKVSPVFSDAPNENDFFLVLSENRLTNTNEISETPWALQTPDPLTTMAWDTWVEINEKVAKELSIKEGDVVFINSVHGEIRAIAYLSPAVRPDVLVVPVGMGHQFGGRYSSGQGSNVLKIVVNIKDEKAGTLAWASTKVSIVKQGTRAKVPKAEGHVKGVAVEPGFPVLVVAPDETAEEAEEKNHHAYQQSFYTGSGTSTEEETTQEEETQP